jgi:hypothetical protein
MNKRPANNRNNRKTTGKQPKQPRKENQYELKFVLSFSEVAEVCPKMTFEMYPVTFPSFQSRVHFVRTTLKTLRKKMSANSRACILYRKNYNMRHPIFASIILLLPALPQDSTGEFVRKSKTSFLQNNEKFMKNE